MIVQQLRANVLVGTVNILLVASSLAQAPGEGSAATTPTGNEEVRLSEILVAAPSLTDRAQREQAKKKAEDLLKRIRNGEDFADIAKSNSDGPTAKLGGDLRFFAHGKLAPSLERIVFSMKVGDVSDVVQTKQGFVILKVLDKRIGMAAGVLANTPPAESGVQILSDTLGFDFYPYLNQSVVPAVRENWYKVIPKEALPPTRKKGRVVIEISLEKDGNVTEIRLGPSAGGEKLERAVRTAVTMTPFPPLPAAFPRRYVALRFIFYYNDVLHFTLSPTAIQLHAGEAQQFSANSSVGENALSWNLTGPGCTQQLCGTVSPNGLYTAPSVVSEHRELTVSARSVSDPSESATATITLEPTKNPFR